MRYVYRHRIGFGKKNVLSLITLVAGFLLTLWIAHAQIVNSYSFEISVRGVYSYPARDSVRVPVIMSSSDSIGGWALTMEYDASGGSLIDVELCDSALALDPPADTLVWYYASWHGHPELRPEYLELTSNYEGVLNRVRVAGLVDTPTFPQIPAMPPKDDALLFCFIFSTDPMWDGHPVGFAFRTSNCTDNNLTDGSGSIVWGADTASASASTCPQRADSLRAVRLVGGSGVVHGQSPEFIRADADGDMIHTMADAMQIVDYIYRQGACGCKDCYDANDDRNISIADAVYVVGYIHRDGLPPPHPFPNCGADTTADELGCENHSCMGAR